MKKLIALFLIATPAFAVSPGATYIQYSNSGTPTLVSSVNPLPVAASVSLSNPPVGVAVPSTANYIAGNQAGVLTGLLVGQQTMANSLACVLPSDQSAIPVTGTFWQATQPVSIASSVTVAQATGSNLHVVVDTTPTTAVTGTFWQATQPISAASLPLPTGAATSAKQPALGTAGTASSDVITVQGIASMTALKVDGSAVTQPVSGTVSATQSGAWNITNISGTVSLPTGASTSALQTTANTSLATIATNSGKIPPNTTAAFSQTSVTTTASTVSAPANAVRVLIQGDSSNTDCIRYRFDGTAATATVGVVAQPGQDSGQLDSGMNVSVAACSGTQKVNVQYLAQ